MTLGDLIGYVLLAAIFVLVIVPDIRRLVRIDGRKKTAIFLLELTAAAAVLWVLLHLADQVKL
jgi:hypothetical protein